MKEIVVISGKGGTGKTSVTGSFAYLSSEKTVLADCDVDASDLHILLKPEIITEENFLSSYLAVIDYDKCVTCGKCFEVCRFKAVSFEDDKFRINNINCEGCGYCAKVCPSAAIDMQIQNDGKLYVSKTRLNKTLFHAELGPGAENSGKLVAKVKNNAKKYARENNLETVLVDGSPGIGCPVISSLSGADYVVLVTEPTVSGSHDLKRVIELVKKFKIRMGCVINKCDINLKLTAEIKQFLNDQKIDLLTELPYDDAFTKAMIEGKTVAEFSNEIGTKLQRAWYKITELMR
ncbi:MAG TPA: ATP-binding protein [Clostridiales bacterium]|nr:ATP-binding protein [Clostridiales bacterium]HQP69122.1 ATP-binding protein [Clostridiales bacterium]